MGKQTIKVNTGGIQLGMKVRCMVTGFEGIAYQVVLAYNGCASIDVRPSVDEKGDLKNGKWLDIPQLEIIDKDPNGLVTLHNAEANAKAAIKKKKSRGGPIVDSSERGVHRGR